jgi:hypothetical protein
MGKDSSSHQTILHDSRRTNHRDIEKYNQSEHSILGQSKNNEL